MPARPTLAPVPLLLVLLAAGCGEAPPTGPAAESGDPLLGMHGNGATTEFQEFEFTPPGGIPVPAPCLGGTFLVTGTITGWSRITTSPNGHRAITERTDFTGLSATSNGDTWVAAPGAHEIFSFSLWPVGDAALVAVHEGHSRFISQGDRPDVRFVHRIHQNLLPSGELHVNRVTFEAVCIGRNR